MGDLNERSDYTNCTIGRGFEKINSHNFMRVYNSVWRLVWINFLRGLAFGLGSVIGATILVYVLLQILAQIEFIPILGDWALRLIAGDENL
jgi:hypothetical protein